MFRQNKKAAATDNNPSPPPRAQPLGEKRKESLGLIATDPWLEGTMRASGRPLSSRPALPSTHNLPAEEGAAKSLRKNSQKHYDPHWHRGGSVGSVASAAAANHPSPFRSIGSRGVPPTAVILSPRCARPLAEPRVAERVLGVAVRHPNGG